MKSVGWSLVDGDVTRNSYLGEYVVGTPHSSSHPIPPALRQNPAHPIPPTFLQKPAHSLPPTPSTQPHPHTTPTNPRGYARHIGHVLPRRARAR